MNAIATEKERLIEIFNRARVNYYTDSRGFLIAEGVVFALTPNGELIFIDACGGDDSAD